MQSAAEGAREGLSSVSRGTLVMLLGTLGWVGENFVARVFLVRSLSPEEWGAFSLGLALAGLLSAIGALGLPTAVARSLSYSSQDSERRAILREAFVVAVPVAIVLACAMAFLGVPLGGNDPLLGLTLELFGISLGFSLISGLIAAVFQGYEDVVPNAFFVQVLNPTLFIGFLVAAVGVHSIHLSRAALSGIDLSYPQALAGYLAANVITLAALLAYTQWRLPKLLPSGPRAPGVARRLFTFAAPLFAVGVLGFVTQNGDTILLGALNLAQVGFYTASLSLSRLLLVGMGSLGFIFLPVTTRFVRAGNRDAVRVVYATATKWMAVTSLPLFLLFFFLPGRSLGFVFGDAYSGNVVPLKIVVAGAFASTLVGPSTAAQVSFGQTRLLLYNTVVSATTDVGLSLLLIPAFGVTGAAIAWASANALYPILSAAELAVLTGVHPFERHYLLPLALTGVPLALVFSLVAFPVPVWALPLIVLGIGFAFVLVVTLTGSVDQGDRMLLEVAEGFLGRRIPFVRRLGRIGASARPPGP